MNVVPLLGENFNLYFPIVLVVLIVINVFQLWSRMLACCGKGKDLAFQPYESIPVIEEGERLIRAALRERQDMAGEEVRRPFYSITRSLVFVCMYVA